MSSFLKTPRQADAAPSQDLPCNEPMIERIVKNVRNGYGLSRDMTNWIHSKYSCPICWSQSHDLTSCRAFADHWTITRPTLVSKKPNGSKTTENQIFCQQNTTTSTKTAASTTTTSIDLSSPETLIGLPGKVAPSISQTDASAGTSVANDGYTESSSQLLSQLHQFESGGGEDTTGDSQPPRFDSFDGDDTTEDTQPPQFESGDGEVADDGATNEEAVFDQDLKRKGRCLIPRQPTNNTTSNSNRQPTRSTMKYADLTGFTEEQRIQHRAEQHRRYKPPKNPHDKVEGFDRQERVNLADLSKEEIEERKREQRRRSKLKMKAKRTAKEMEEAKAATPNDGDEVS